jgi:hypothetical protein
MTIVASLRERSPLAPPGKGATSGMDPVHCVDPGPSWGLPLEPLSSKIATVLKAVSAHRGQASGSAILMAIVREGPVDADGLWKAVDGYEVQQEESAHRFPRALGKPANGRRFPTAPTRPRPQGFSRAVRGGRDTLLTA